MWQNFLYLADMMLLLGFENITKGIKNKGKILETIVFLRFKFKGFLPHSSFVTSANDFDICYNKVSIHRLHHKLRNVYKLRLLDDQNV